MGIDQIMIFSEIPLSLKVFNISNLSITLTNKCRNQEDENIFIIIFRRETQKKRW